MPTDKRQRQREGREYRRAQIQAAQRRRAVRRRGYGIGVVVVAVGIVIAVLNINGSGSPTKVATMGSTTTIAAVPSTTTTLVPQAPDQTGGTLATWSCPKPDGSSPHILHFPKTAPPMCLDPAKTYTAVLTTNQGEVDFTLDTKTTPKTANNYYVLSLYHYYDGTSIDRIDTSIDILQSGSPSTQTIADPGPGYTIPDEGSGYKYAAGDVVMARGSAANSGAAQYFFVVGPKAAALDSQGTYVTFGHVTKGLDVLQKIEGMNEPCPASDQACLGGVPKTVVLISKVTITAS